MKKIVLGVFLAVFTLGCFSQETGTGPADFKTEKEKASYVVGYNMGKNLKALGLNLDLGVLIKGLKDAAFKASPLIDEKDLQGILKKAIAEAREKMQQKWDELAAKNKLEGEAFLKENAKKTGVKTTASGLQYEILAKGTGKIPVADDLVEVHYRGTLIDGKEFHNSYTAGKPVVFQAKRTYAGWTEALQMMSVGSKWRLYLPPQLGFGEQGLGDAVGPNAVIILETELLAIKQPGEK